MRSGRSVLLPIIMFAIAAPAVAEESPEGHEQVHNRIGLFLGAAQKDDPHGHETLPEAAWGIHYDRILSPGFGFAVMYEEEGGEIDTRALIVPLFFTLGQTNWLAGAGPGIEQERETHENNFLFRVSIGYEIELGHHWSIAPEFNVDWVDVEHGDSTTAILGANLSRAF